MYELTQVIAKVFAKVILKYSPRIYFCAESIPPLETPLVVLPGKVLPGTKPFQINNFLNPWKVALEGSNSLGFPWKD